MPVHLLARSHVHLIGQATFGAVIGSVSDNLHVSSSVLMPDDRILLEHASEGFMIPGSRECFPATLIFWLKIACKTSVIR